MRDGKLSTGFIAEEYPEGFKPRKPEGSERDVLVAVAAVIDHLANARRREISHQMTGRSVTFAKRRVVNIAGEGVAIEVAGETGKSYQVTFGKSGETVSVQAKWTPGEPVWVGTINGKAAAVQVRPILNGHRLSYRGIQTDVYVYTEREAELAALMPEKVAADMSKFLLCPMPGLVKAIHVEEGQEIKAGDPLAVVEAMKMENILKAERDATVKKINAKAGDSLAVDAVIIEFA